MRTSAIATLFFLQPAFAQLNTLAKAAGLKYFGTATDNGELSDSAYVAILSDNTEFGQITAGNAQKWDAIEPKQGTFSFAKGDAIVSSAQKNSQLLRCHTTVWHNQLPSWVSGGSFTNATLIAVMINHISKEIAHYKGQCYAWDVVNEAIDDGGQLRNDVFLKVIGPSYIPIAFAAAAAADPDAKLYYNDYNIESGAKMNAALAIVKQIKDAGVKIDGVGIQGHYILGSTPSETALAGTLKKFADLGVEVAFTELDIRMKSNSADNLAKQSDEYAGVVKACLDVSACVGLTIWDFDDKFSWVPTTFSGFDYALPWNKDLTKKPCYQGIAAALESSTRAPDTSPGPSAIGPFANGTAAVGPAANGTAAVGSATTGTEGKQKGKDKPISARARRSMTQNV